jgi:twitching motility protein PilT
LTTPYASEPFLHQLLGKALAAGCSDVHLKVGQAPGARVRGDLVFFRVDKIRPEDTEAALRILLGPARSAVLDAGHPQTPGTTIHSPLDLVFAYEAPGLGRFRVAAYRAGGAVSLVMRSIPLKIPTLADLGLPAAATALIEQQRGIVIIAGGSGSGKSTTAAALLGHLNESYPRHILTFEDPVELVHEDARGSVSQRAIGVDVASLTAGLHRALTQDPDVVFVSDLRAVDALEAVLDIAELGHLVLVTVASPDAARAVARLLGLGRAVPDFGARFAAALQGVLAQKLLPKRDGSGLVLACEVLVATVAVREAIRGGSSEQGDVAAALRWQMEKGATPYGMQTFEVHARALSVQGLVSKATVPG